MDTGSVIEEFIINELLMANGTEKLGHDQSLISTVIIDSLAILRLVSFMEEQFGVKVEDGDVVPENFETINVMKKYVDERL